MWEEVFNDPQYKADEGSGRRHQQEVEQGDGEPQTDRRHKTTRRQEECFCMWTKDYSIRLSVFFTRLFLVLLAAGVNY